MTDLLAIWRRYASMANILDRRPDFRFDPDFYGAQRQDLSQDPEGLREHYQLYGKDEGLAPSLYLSIVPENADVIAVIGRLVVDPELLTAIESGDPEAYHLAFELLHLGAPILFVRCSCRDAVDIFSSLRPLDLETDN